MDSSLTLLAIQTPRRLVGIGQAAHAAHDTENVVVRRVDVHVRGGLLVALANKVAVDVADGRKEGRGREREVEDRIVDTGEVARATGLEVLGLEGEGVDVDARRRRGRVVLVRLHEVEVAALTLRETILAVELDLGDGRRVAEGRIGVAPRGVRDGVAVNVAGVLDNPDNLLARVVEGELDLVGRGRDGFRARELELLDEVLVGNLGEAATLLRVEVDVVDIERARDETLLANVGQNLLRGGDCAATCNVDVAEILKILELDVDLDLVVLEGNEGKCKARVAVEPELERDVERLFGDAAGGTRNAINLDSVLERAIITLAGDGGVEARKRNRIVEA